MAFYTGFDKQQEALGDSEGFAMWVMLIVSPQFCACVVKFEYEKWVDFLM